ncbi:putative tyrosine-protein kinase YveL [Lactiplantibacillus plantarum]|uniref:hypothetical protein n=1 Tax=Lactiplantibacillus plantarum TaxID=1590 RepID=UPI0038532C91|nr:putative tyrosine-protein kinase YveL [Lactiplantibacillus plantarum]
MDDIKQAIRKINTQLLDQKQKIDSLVFLTTNKNATQPTIIANLAIMYAQSKKKTIIVDTDFSTDRFSGAFNFQDRSGLTDYLEQDISYTEIIKNVPGIDLSVILPGSVQDDTSALLDDPKFNKLVDTLKTQYELVIVNTPQFKEMSPLRNIFHVSKNIVLVIDKDQTSKRALFSMVKSCLKVDGNILGYISAK